jgi:hypothetical protein
VGCPLFFLREVDRTRGVSSSFPLQGEGKVGAHCSFPVKEIGQGVSAFVPSIGAGQVGSHCSFSLKELLEKGMPTVPPF